MNKLAEKIVVIKKNRDKIRDILEPDTLKYDFSTGMTSKSYKNKLKNLLLSKKSFDKQNPLTKSKSIKRLFTSGELPDTIYQTKGIDAVDSVRYTK